MRIRRFIAAIMILLSLSAQAGNVFACSMMPGASPPLCCCPAQSPDHCPPAANGLLTGCDLAAPGDALPQGLAAAYGVHPAPAKPNGPPPLAAVDAYLLPVSFDAGGKRRLSPQLDASRQRIRPLYLQTARLRL